MAIYSYSRLKVFRTCPRQFRFIYVDRIERREETIETLLGNCFHSVMEKLYKDIKFKMLGLQELLEYYEEIWVEVK